MSAITFFGATWCEDTRRSLRHLRRLGIPHRFENVDEDLDALDRAKALNGGQRRTPTIDLGLGGTALVEPDNDTLTGALVEIDMLTRDEADERLAVQNVGDVERVGRTLAGLAVLALGSTVPRAARWPVRLAGAIVALTGLTGWCPAYQYFSVTSLGGPGDRPDEASRVAWLTPNPAESPSPTASPVGQDGGNHP
jgi:Inner membrane protein YgaP-like, transmembrane domain